MIREREKLKISSCEILVSRATSRPTRCTRCRRLLGRCLTRFPVFLAAAQIAGELTVPLKNLQKTKILLFTPTFAFYGVIDSRYLQNRGSQVDGLVQLLDGYFILRSFFCTFIMYSQLADKSRRLPYYDCW